MMPGTAARIDRRPGTECPVVAELDRQITGRPRRLIRVCVRARHATQQRAHPCEKLGRTERFGQVVVCACLQSGDRVGLGIACRQHQDWRHTELAQTPRHFTSVQSRHHDVVGEFNFQLSVATVPAL